MKKLKARIEPLSIQDESGAYYSLDEARDLYRDGLAVAGNGSFKVLVNSDFCVELAQIKVTGWPDYK